MDLSPVQIPTVLVFSFDILRNPELRKLEFFYTTFFVNFLNSLSLTYEL